MRRLGLLSVVLVGLAIASCTHSPSSLPPAFVTSGSRTVHDTAPAYALLHAFSAPPDGNSPTQDLVQSNTGSLIYGTTYGGGKAPGDCAKGCGTIYTIDPASGKEDVVWDFRGASANPPDGAIPEAGLTAFTGGFFGTTFYGGEKSASCYTARGCGTVYEITITPSSSSSVSEKVVYAFKGGGADGANPLGGLRIINGVIWGTTEYGGQYGFGSVFIMPTPSASGAVQRRQAVQDQVVYSFRGPYASPPDGAYPNGNLAQDTNGDVVGVTLQGGNENVGTIFEITKSESAKVLYSFNQDDGDFPVGLERANSGVFYGAASSDGANRRGSIFAFNPETANFKVIHAFRGKAKSDGALPYSRPTLYFPPGHPAILFGTTQGGGSRGNGTIYRIETSGNNYECIVHSFGPTPSDGLRPDAPLRQFGDDFYGTTVEGGSTKDTVGLGTVFTFSPLAPCATSDPARPSVIRPTT